MKKIILSLFMVIASLLFVSPPALAAKCFCGGDKSREGVITSILGEEGVDEGGHKVNCKCDDGKGSSIIDILKLVVSIMTIGVGILGVVGISIVGTQYLTAGGNEEKTRKAKRRMFEIVLGLAAYAIIYALLSWLLPNFSI